ncbi:MAG: O-antigen ligase family protein [Actinomycetota bacterium]|nr:O-antigen ligase family protein [Actinomycetota bacterium]
MSSALWPLMVAVVILGTVYVVVAVRNLAAGIVLFTVLIFFALIPSIASSGITFAKLGGVILAVAWLLRLLNRNRPAMLFRDHPVVAFIVVLVAAWAFASSLWAPNPAVAISDAFRFAQEMLLVFAVYSAIESTRHVWWVIWAFIGGAVVSALIGLAGATPRDQYSPLGQSRLGGGIGDPNELAAFLVPAIVFAMFALAVVRTALARWLLVSSVVVCALALFRTESRGGIVASGVVLIVALLLSGPVRLRALVGISATAAFGLLYFTVLAPPQAFARITGFRGDQGSGRIDIWNVAVQVFRHHPIFGVGAGNFRVVEPLYAITDINLRATRHVLGAAVVHNTYLSLLAEVGVIGFLLFAAVVIAALKMAMQAVREFAAAGNSEMEVLSRGLIIGTVGMLAAFFFLSAQHEKQLPLLLGLLMALLSVARASAITVGPRRDGDSPQALLPGPLARGRRAAPGTSGVQ